MAKPSPDLPFDPNEFTTEGLQLARRMLLSLRERPPAGLIIPIVTYGKSVEWRKTPNGGEARYKSCMTVQRGNSFEYIPEALPIDEGWFPCENRNNLRPSGFPVPETDKVEMTIVKISPNSADSTPPDGSRSGSQDAIH